MHKPPLPWTYCNKPLKTVYTYYNESRKKKKKKKKIMLIKNKWIPSNQYNFPQSLCNEAEKYQAH